MIDVPPVVREKARVAGAGAWLDDLPLLLAELRRRWGISVGRAYAGGTEAYVAGATRADGTPAVVKLMIPRAGDHARHEITVLRLAGGHGCVRLLEADEDRGAMLLERLGPALTDLGFRYERRLDILCDAAREVWRPAAGLPTGAQKGRRLAARTGTDPVAIWEWGLAERVSTGLLAVRVGLQPVGGQMLAAADEISRRAG